MPTFPQQPATPPDTPPQHSKEPLFKEYLSPADASLMDQGPRYPLCPLFVDHA